MPASRSFAEIRAGYGHEAERLEDVRAVCSDGDTLLHRAAFQGDARDTRDLLELGSDPNAEGDLGNTALHYAAMQGHLGVVAILLAADAVREFRNELGQKPADCAEIAGHWNVVAALRPSRRS